MSNLPMQWFTLIIFCICLLAYVSISITAFFITRNSFTLAIPAPLLVTMRPMIYYLFPQQNTRKKKKP